MRLKPQIKFALITVVFGLLLLLVAVRYSITPVTPMRFLGYEVRDDSVYAVLEVENLGPTKLFPGSIHYVMEEEAYWRISETNRTRLTYGLNPTIPGTNQALHTYVSGDITWKSTNGTPNPLCLLRLKEGNDFYQLEHLINRRLHLFGRKIGPSFGHQIRRSPLIPSLARYHASNPAQKAVEALSVRITQE